MIEQERENYELFRRAILYRDAEAWATIHQRFRPLLIAWVRCRGTRAHIAKEYADIADQALARAWVALTPERFGDFPSLARLLGYLRVCVATTLIDSIREETAKARALSELDADTTASPEQIVLADLDRAALWRTAIALTATQAERVALVESFAYGLPPRSIRERHPQIFPDVAAVYSAKRNLIERLQRSSDLRRLREDFVSS